MKKTLLVAILAAVILSAGCDLIEELKDWTEETHGNSVSPNYDVVFNGDIVRRFDIVIDPDDWQAMLDDMTVMYGPFGERRSPGPNVGQTNPIFVPCSLLYEGKEWYHVGIRFKGNSSLFSTWHMGIWKLALKLDFDEFEDDFPEINNQRFYGFRQLSMSNNFSDMSFIREKVTTEIFRDMGIRAAHTAYYRVFIDHGEGSKYFGLYTAVEVVDDTVLEDQFGSDSGNCYKPEREGATFAAGMFRREDFVKKNNEAEADWSDIIAVFDALHSAARQSNPAQWRSGLESVFDADYFMKWLAVNTVMQNWDTYGNMGHNYYLYNDPTTGQIRWIPWDNNQALNDGGIHGSLSLGLGEVANQWPLIRFLKDDPVYREKYISYVKDTIEQAFYPSKMIPRYRLLHDLIEPYVIGAEGETPGHTFLLSPNRFNVEFNYLINHVNRRYAESLKFISN